MYIIRLQSALFTSLARAMGERKKVGYLRFLKNLSPSSSVTYSNPASMSSVTCLGALAVLHVHWTSSVRNRACSMLM